ncbi:hypothetical protein H4219_003621 [Mycoemilia scoparia]|uniref:Uncharacterized protein n=1 Tax=Mycoemilia scoparia TaxID=417184 RepID=A0A9W7ZU98_9FUNG|nr:hypothetical protein H4219_003621 [Mycoemilia scoparia]
MPKTITSHKTPPSPSRNKRQKTSQASSGLGSKLRSTLQALRFNHGFQKKWEISVDNPISPTLTYSHGFYTPDPQKLGSRTDSFKGTSTFRSDTDLRTNSLDDGQSVNGFVMVTEEMAGCGSGGYLQRVQIDGMGFTVPLRNSSDPARWASMPATSIAASMANAPNSNGIQADPLRIMYNPTSVQRSKSSKSKESSEKTPPVSGRSRLAALVGATRSKSEKLSSKTLRHRKSRNFEKRKQRQSPVLPHVPPTTTSSNHPQILPDQRLTNLNQRHPSTPPPVPPIPPLERYKPLLLNHQGPTETNAENPSDTDASKRATTSQPQAEIHRSGNRFSIQSQITEVKPPSSLAADTLQSEPRTPPPNPSLRRHRDLSNTLKTYDSTDTLFEPVPSAAQSPATEQCGEARETLVADPEDWSFMSPPHPSSPESTVRKRTTWSNALTLVESPTANRTSKYRSPLPKNFLEQASMAAKFITDSTAPAGKTARGHYFHKRRIQSALAMANVEATPKRIWSLTPPPRFEINCSAINRHSVEPNRKEKASGNKAQPFPICKLPIPKPTFRVSSNSIPRLNMSLMRYFSSWLINTAEISIVGSNRPLLWGLDKRHYAEILTDNCWAAMPLLRKASLVNIGLAVVPSGFENHSLVELDLSYNWIEEIPHWIGTLSNLSILRLRGNVLSTVPVTLVTRCRSLRTLDMDSVPRRGFSVSRPEPSNPTADVREALLKRIQHRLTDHIQSTFRLSFPHNSQQNCQAEAEKGARLFKIYSQIAQKVSQNDLPSKPAANSSHHSVAQKTGTQARREAFSGSSPTSTSQTPHTPSPYINTPISTKSPASSLSGLPGSTFSPAPRVISTIGKNAASPQDTRRQGRNWHSSDGGGALLKSWSRGSHLPSHQPQLPVRAQNINICSV